jgi:type IV secretory pathway VirB2 component (pilin)
MRISFPFCRSRGVRSSNRRADRWSTIVVAILPLIFPLAALAQSPFDTGFTAIQTLFTGTVAKVASLVAIVIGGYGFAHGEPGAKKALAGLALFIGGFTFGHRVTNSDPAFLRILARSERYKLRYDAAKQQVPRVEVR